MIDSYGAPDLFAVSILVELSISLLEMEVQFRHLADDELLLQRVLVDNEQHVVDILLVETNS